MFHKTSLLTVLLFLCITITVFGAWPKAENIVVPPGATLGWDNANGYWRPLGSSFSDGAMSVLDYEHHKIHEGRHFFSERSFTLGSNAVASYVIQAPASSTDLFTHVIFVLEGSAITEFNLYEGSDLAPATAATSFNNNRNSAITAQTLIYSSANASGTIGTLLSGYKSGSASQQSRSAAISQSVEEKILKVGTQYHLRITSGTADNLVNVKILWYEQPK